MRDVSRLLSIGEFAAATQLSPKALRLYDEQHILRPAAVDAASGYRYYSREQIALGRLIRVLRDMELPLADVAEVVTATGARAETLLHQFALESERRFARQQRALQAAMALLRQSAPAELPAITERERAAVTIAVQPFLAERRFLRERLQSEVAKAQQSMAAAGLASAGEPFCILIDPPSDEDGRVEAAIPLAAPAGMPHGITIRQLPTATCAALVVPAADAGIGDLTGALDALFDWFDRRGHRALDAPALSFLGGAADGRAELTWAYEAAASAPNRR